jgi:exodeoxyribonuclease VIII
MSTVTLKNMLHTVQKIAEETLTELYVWSHGSNFDIVILENAYKAIGQAAWWKYSNVRDTRTLFDLAEHKYVSKGGHDALDDAMRQAEAVAYAYNKLMKGSRNGSTGQKV